MSTSTESKQYMDDEDEEGKTYSVEEDDESETDDFARVKPHILRTPSVLNAIVEQIHPDIISKSHQSNFVLFPPKLEGCTVVDLGCGVGRDAFILSKLVGDNGRVIGIDSEKDKLDFARQHIDYHTKKFELNQPNVEFIEGEIDKLEETILKENTADVVVSNSVINYQRNKKAIIEGVSKILKPGGEFYFSDVYVNRAIPREFQESLSGEHIAGALRWEDLILYATEAGFTEPRLVTAKPYLVTNEDIQKAIGKTKFVSAIFRFFKLPFNDNDSTAFNIPYQLTYEIPLTSSEEEFFFDHSLQFKLGELLVVDDPSIAFALNLSRYKDNFTFDPIDVANTETITIIEKEEVLPTSQASNDDKTDEVYHKTTTITTSTIAPNDPILG